MCVLLTGLQGTGSRPQPGSARSGIPAVLPGPLRPCPPPPTPATPRVHWRFSAESSNRLPQDSARETPRDQSRESRPAPRGNPGSLAVVFFPPCSERTGRQGQQGAQCLLMASRAHSAGLRARDAQARPSRSVSLRGQNGGPRARRRAPKAGGEGGGRRRPPPVCWCRAPVAQGGGRGGGTQSLGSPPGARGPWAPGPRTAGRRAKPVARRPLTVAS